MPPLLRSSVTVRVPATSANLGPGFDVLGLALDVFNDLTISTVEPSGERVTAFRITVEGEGADWLPRDASNMCAVAVRLALVEAGVCAAATPSSPDVWDGPPLHMHLVNRIPIGAGLGSSSAAIVAGLLAGLTLAQHTLAVSHEERLLQLAATIEGHVDNLAPCIYGGLQIGVHTGTRWDTTGVSVPAGLQCILFIPDIRQSTEGARAVLPSTISRADAVFNIGRAALLVNAFASGHLGALALGTQDALHQRAREGIMPALAPCIAAAMSAGADGAFLSGAGSAIMALASGRKGDIHGQAPGERRDVRVARAMATAARERCGAAGRVLITQPTSQGAHVIALDGDANAVLEGRGLQLELDAAGELQAARDGSGGTPPPSLATMPVGARAAAEGVQSPPPPRKQPRHPRALPVSPEASAWLAAARRGSGGVGGGGGGAPPPIIKYSSTRGGGVPLTFAGVVFAGTAPDGGLYMPSRIPLLDRASLLALHGLPYAHVAARVLALFIEEDDIPFADLIALCEDAYSNERWSSPSTVPLVALGGGSSPLLLAELFHGPTSAFKDAALQLLGRLFAYLIEGGGPLVPPRATILGATSGDTGAAAISGLAGQRGVTAVILHPEGRVARVQHLQMTTVLDASVHNVAIRGGDFDACQASVKAAFSDASFVKRHALAAINSINWARILAQSVYYVWTYLQWLQCAHPQGVADDASMPLPLLSFVVPTGNFGNVLSGRIAQLMGLPIRRLHAATNANDAVHRALRGDYSVGGGNAMATLAPSMDIQVASNFERCLWLAACEDAAGSVGGGVAPHEAVIAAAASAVRVWQAALAGPARAAVLPPRITALLARDFSSSSASDSIIDATIKETLSATGYALCPHTATGVAAVQHGLIPRHDASHMTSIVILATAHPGKFADGTPSLAAAGVFADMSAAGAAGARALPPLPPQLRGLDAKPQRCATIAAGEGLAKSVMAFVDAVVPRV